MFGRHEIGQKSSLRRSYRFFCELDEEVATAVESKRLTEEERSWSVWQHVQTLASDPVSNGGIFCRGYGVNGDPE